MIEEVRNVLTGDAPVFLLIAGPNGAGKSTFRATRLPPEFPCIDPDAVGREIFGGHPSTKDEALQASQEATRRVRERFVAKQSVGLETVFSDSKGYKLELLREARDTGFRTVLIFIGVDDPQVSIARVADRVDHGGHDIPDEVIEDRFPRCFENLKTAFGIADFILLVDNTGGYGPEEEQTEGLRHYVFGYVERGARCVISNRTPHWFESYGIATELQSHYHKR